jgi:hypothetical protein
VKKIHEIISNLPYVIIGYCLLFYIIGTIGFYHEYFLILDDLDFIPVAVCLLHFGYCLLRKLPYYNSVKTVLVCAIILLFLMYKLRHSIDDDIYWILYLSALFGGIVTALLTYFITRRE